MSFATKIPSVLQQPKGNSLSVERVLKQARDLLMNYPSQNNENELMICIEDLETLIQNIDRK
jgi:hypothetical protein